ncbi:MAG: hypothetical protein RI907_639 [Pseudomonadota bacterium]|jgi:hypothetical protein
MRAIAWAWVGVLALTAVSVGWADGAAVYSLDDPYIHLALARSIQQGGYGINPGEWASPSSSPLWPWLLAVVPVGAMAWAPWCINAVCAVATTWVMRQALRGPWLPERWQAPAAVLAAFGVNAFGLVMTGMEHSLQVALVAFMAWRVTQRRFDVWLYAAMAVGPLVRYEVAALTAPLAVWLWWAHGRRWGPLLATGVAVAGLLAFSLWLHHLGLPWLPSSVLAKNAERKVLVNVLSSPGFYFLLWWLWRTTDDRRDWWLLMALPLAGFLVLGRVGWLGRYEAFMAAWLLVMALHAASRYPWGRAQAEPPRVGVPQWPVRWLLGLCLCVPALWTCTLRTPQACLNTQRQQVVMAELARQLGRPVAVNDLGLVAWRSGQHVVDLWGLGSPEVLARRLQHTVPPEVWMDEVTRAKGVSHAFIFERWFPKVPPGWTKVGELRLNVDTVVLPSKVVSLYATTPEAASALREAMRRVAQDPVRRALLVEL